MDRVQLVNMVITGLLTYSFNLYKWPISLLKQIEQWCRNFIWAGDILKKGIAIVNCATICSPLENGGLKIINLHHENNAYLLKLAWKCAYSNKHWSLLLKARVLKSKYEFRMVYRSSSLWPAIRQFYSTILYYTSWIVGTCSFINFWNDKWCGTTSLANIVGLSNNVSIPDTVSQLWTGGDCNIPLSLQQMPHLFSHIMVRAEHDIPNWIVDESGRFTLKSARTFFLDPKVPCGWGKFIWSSYLPSSKTLVLWKFFHRQLPTDQHIQNKGLHICSMRTFCEKHEEFIHHLFF